MTNLADVSAGIGIDAFIHTASLLVAEITTIVSALAQQAGINAGTILAAEQIPGFTRGLVIYWLTQNPGAFSGILVRQIEAIGLSVAHEGYRDTTEAVGARIEALSGAAHPTAPFLRLIAAIRTIALSIAVEPALHTLTAQTRELVFPALTVDRLGLGARLHRLVRSVAAVLLPVASPQRGDAPPAVARAGEFSLLVAVPPGALIALVRGVLAVGLPVAHPLGGDAVAVGAAEPVVRAGVGAVGLVGGDAAAAVQAVVVAVAHPGEEDGLSYFAAVEARGAFFYIIRWMINFETNDVLGTVLLV